MYKIVQKTVLLESGLAQTPQNKANWHTDLGSVSKRISFDLCALEPDKFYVKV